MTRLVEFAVELGVNTSVEAQVVWLFVGLLLAFVCIGVLAWCYYRLGRFVLDDGLKKKEGEKGG